jgi:hypothetical protein
VGRGAAGCTHIHTHTRPANLPYPLLSCVGDTKKSRSSRSAAGLAAALVCVQLLALNAPPAAAAAASSTTKLTLLPDPLDLSGDLPSDYRNWAAVLAQIMLATTSAQGGARGGPRTSAGGGGSSPAVQALGRVLLATHARLAALADGGEGPEALFPRFHMALPPRLADALGKERPADPQWAAHLGLDGAGHPVPDGCEGVGPTPAPNTTVHPHMMEGAAASAAPTPPQAPAPPDRRQQKAGARALLQHDHGTTATPAGGHDHGGHGGHGGGGDHGGHDHMRCHSMTGHAMVHKLWTSKAFVNYQVRLRVG